MLGSCADGALVGMACSRVWDVSRPEGSESLPGTGVDRTAAGARLAGLAIGEAVGVVTGVATGTGQSSPSVDNHVGSDGQTLLPRVPDELSAGAATVIVALVKSKRVREYHDS